MAQTPLGRASSLIQFHAVFIIFGMELLAQISGEAPSNPLDGLETFFSLHLLFLWGTFGLLSFVYTVFWVWMMIECIRSEPDKFFWIWLLIVVPFPGAIVYAVVRYYPTSGHRTPDVLRRWTRGRELARLETAAEQIGNSHQFVQWGDALREAARWNDAASAYDQALKKEPRNLQALWGAALVAEHRHDPDEVARCTRQILDKDPQYKFGDVSLAYGQALADQGQPEAAREHLEQHIKRWRHPEALYRLACLCEEAGEPDIARQHLRSLLQDLNASPPPIARRHGRWKSRARQMLRKLPQNP